MPHRMRILGLALFVFALVGASDRHALAAKRVALVIGNADYQHVPTLENPTKDAAAVAATFKRIGFDVRLETNLEFPSLRRALRDFGRQSQDAEMAVVYYAGHGVEIDGGNYLIPVDAQLSHTSDVHYEAIALDLVLASMEDVDGVRLVILDACRNTPFLAGMKGGGTRSIGRGLARVEPPLATLVAFAAKEGTTAADGAGAHSPYTAALLEQLPAPGVDVQLMFRKVRDQVLSATNGEQEPFTYGSLPGTDIFLQPPKSSPPPEAASGEPSTVEAIDPVELAIWNAAASNEDPTLLGIYLERYPDGAFAQIARVMLGGVLPSGSSSSGPEPSENLSDNDLARLVQTELARVGCYGQRVDGIWGPNSRRAATRFASLANVELDVAAPSRALFSAVKEQEDRVCPLECGARYEIKNGSCVLKACPSGERLTSNGTCVTATASSGSVRSTRSDSAMPRAVCRTETLDECRQRVRAAGGRGLRGSGICRGDNRRQICN